ncbi:MAG TPA: glycosyltransferase 87 family protein [Chloroflexota bacterium]|nr:glycosyltransferase 87 family protein [Chloroflexota bacterium]
MSLLRTHPYTLAVFALGLVLRAVLIPITHGQDFVVWNLASRYTLAGINVYAHHPHYPGGPYTYFPLFLYLELPFQWLALHSGVSFTVLGKLPIMAGDLLAAALIATHLRQRGHGDGIRALGTGLYFLNPLVLYNGAFYGRFDALCVGLFLLALRFYDPRQPRSWRFPVLYAYAVAAKTYPVFILPWLLLRERARRGRVVIALVLVLGGLSLPYLITSLGRFFSDIVLYNGRKLPGNLSWQIILLDQHYLSPHGARLLTYVLLALFAVALFLFTRLDLYTYCLVAILLFIVLSKVVIEQYFLWPMPFLILAALDRRSWASWGLLILLSTSGMLINPYIHPWTEQVPAANVAIALCIVVYVLTRRPAPEQAPALAHRAPESPPAPQGENV